jgi:predicted AlkP superfamily pyrophosphatase or phosphodiesterase
MKLLLICIDGVRADLALPDAVAADQRFAAPDHESDPRFGAGGSDGTVALDDAKAFGVIAPTLTRLAAGDSQSEGAIVPMWMTPPTDSGPGWSSILTGSTHEECNVWWNEFVGHQLAKRPDILSRVFFANPAARTIAAATWDALVAASGPGPIIHQRVDQQRTGQHQTFLPDHTQGIATADAAVCQWAGWKLSHEGPDAAVVYFEGVDAAGHEFGSDSQQYRDAIKQADEWTRHLVKAVAERHEQLGEDWLVAVTTDHGHKAEGGHGEDEVEVRRSFLITHRIGGRLPAALAAADPLRSHEVMDLLLDAMGVHQGWIDADGVGELRDFDPVGPTRNPAFEW